MGLLTWKEFKKCGKIQLSDTKIAKNYMTHEELSELTSLVRDWTASVFATNSLSIS